MNTPRLLLLLSVCLVAVFAPAAVAQTLMVQPAQLSFSVQIGDPSPPAQMLMVTSSPAAANFQANIKVGIVTPTWLNLNPTFGTTPGEIAVSIDTSQFTNIGTQQAVLQVRIPTSGALVEVPVNVTVTGTSVLPTAQLSRSELTFQGSSGDPGVGPQTLRVTKEGAGILNYSFAINYEAEGPEGWLTIAPPAASIVTGFTDHVFSVDFSELGTGVFRATVVMSGNGENLPLEIPVTFILGNSPAISANPTRLQTASAAGGPAPPPLTLVISNSSEGVLEYTISTDQTWFSVSPTGGNTGQGPVTHTVSFDNRGLPEGTFFGSITVNSETAANSPVTVEVRMDLGPADDITVSPLTLDFSGPQNMPIGDRRVLNVVSGGGGFANWVASVDPPEANWVVLDRLRGSLPGQLVVGVDTTGLAEGDFDAQILVDLEGAPPEDEPRRIPVRMTLFNQGPVLGATPAALQFRVVEGAGSQSAPFTVDNRGGPELQWTAATPTDDGVAWLSATPLGGVAPTSATATVNPSGLTPGVYSGRIMISAGSQSREIPVTLTVASADPVLDTDVSAVHFEAADEGPAVPQRVRILNRGSGSLAWTARVLPTHGGTSWLSVAPASGVSVGPDPAGSPQLTLTADPRVPTNGNSFALVEIAAADGSSVRYVTASLLKPGANGTPTIGFDPPGIALATAGGAAQSLPTSLEIWTNDGQARPVSIAASTLEGGDWLQIVQTATSTDTNGRALLELEADATSLPPGKYRGSVNVAFANNRVLGVPVTMVARQAELGNCSPAFVAAAPVSLVQNYTVVTGAGVPVVVRVIDGCSNLVNDAQVWATFSSGDRAVVLKNTGSGIYSGTWTPATAGTQITMRINVRSGLLVDSVALVGSVVGTSNARVSEGGVVNGASFGGGPLAPLGITSVFGFNLAFASQPATNVPLPEVLGDTRVRVGTTDSPLFFTSPAQANFQMPADVGPTQILQAVVSTRDHIATPQEIVVADAAPELFFLPDQFRLNRAIAQNPDGSLNGRGNPVRRGQAIVVYLTGQGLTDPEQASGQATPADGMFRRSRFDVRATLNEAEMEVFFLGLTPGFVGLAQANLIVPETADVGDEIELRVFVNGRPSAPLILSVAP